MNLSFNRSSSSSTITYRSISLPGVVGSLNQDHEQEDESHLLDFNEIYDVIEGNDNQDSVNSGSVNADDQHVPVPKKRKLCFFYSYLTFLILYVVFFLVTALRYPLKPGCHINYISLPKVYNKEATHVPNLTMEFSVINLYKLIPLIPISYDSFSIDIYYLSSPNSFIYFTHGIHPEFVARYSQKTTILMISMQPKPALSSLSQLQGKLHVILEFDARFHCRLLCKRKRFYMNADVEVSWTPSKLFFSKNIIMT